MASSHQDTYSIGEVVALLRPEFEISESNLRFWEKQGLLEPQRTQGGHRVYSAADVARIRLIRQMQETRHMPLAAIKHLCTAHGEAAAEVFPFFEAMYRPRHFDAGFRPMTAAALAAETGLDLATIQQLSEWGVLHPARDAEDGEPLFDEDDRQICRLLQEILPTGLPLEAVGRKAALVREHVEAEWEQVVQPILPRLMAIPPQAKLRQKALFEELEALIFDKAKRQLRERLLATGDLNTHCPQGEER